MKKNNPTKPYEIITRSVNFYKIGKYVIWYEANKHPHDMFSFDALNALAVQQGGEPIPELEWTKIKKGMPLVWAAILENGETLTEQEIQGMLNAAAKEHKFREQYPNGPHWDN